MINRLIYEDLPDYLVTDNTFVRPGFSRCLRALLHWFGFREATRVKQC